VGAGGIGFASVLVGAGEIVPEFFLVGAGRVIPACFSVGVLVPSSDPSSARSMKNPPTLLPSFSLSFRLVGGVGSGSILLLSVDGGGMGISWSAGDTDGEMVRSRLS